MVYQRIKDLPSAPGKQLKLFSEQEIYNNYRYSAYFTNLKFATAEIWRLYRARANAENRIKELKYDFGFDSFNLQSFFGPEASLTFAMISYNLMPYLELSYSRTKPKKHSQL